MDFQPRPHRPSRVKTALLILLIVGGAGWIGMQAWWGYQSNIQLAAAEELADRIEAHRSNHEATPVGDTGGIQGSWTDYRGPKRDGIVSGPRLLNAWAANGLKPLYRQPVGGGYAAFVIGNGKAFTIEQRRDQEVVAAYDPLTGTELWKHAWPAYFRERLGGDGPRATPTLAGEWLLAYGAEGDLVCLDAATGALQWRREVLRENKLENLPWAMSGSPLVHEGRVIVTTSGKGGAGVRAYSLSDGKPLWDAVNEQQGYSSPVAVTLAGKTQILILSGQALHGLDPENGSSLWSLPWETSMQISVAQPLLAGKDRIFVSTGYGKGSILLQVNRTATGFEAAEIWTSVKMKNKFTTSVIHAGTIYGLDEGRLVALDLETGDRLWKAREFGHGQLLLADDKLLVLGDEGTLGLVRPSRERYEEINTFQALEGRTWNNPAIAGGILLVRNDREMAAFDLRAP